MKIMEPPRKWLVQCAHPIIIINSFFILFFKMYQIMTWIFSLDTNSCTHCNKFDKWVWRRSLLQVRCWMEANLINGYFGLFNIWGCANKYVWLSYITCLFSIGWVDGLRGSPDFFLLGGWTDYVVHLVDWIISLISFEKYWNACRCVTSVLNLIATRCSLLRLRTLCIFIKIKGVEKNSNYSIKI